MPGSVWDTYGDWMFTSGEADSGEAPTSVDSSQMVPVELRSKNGPKSSRWMAFDARFCTSECAARVPRWVSGTSSPCGPLAVTSRPEA